MDTLSRRHRLRLQQERLQQQLQPHRMSGVAPPAEALKRQPLEQLHHNSLVINHTLVRHNNINNINANNRNNNNNNNNNIIININNNNNNSLEAAHMKPGAGSGPAGAMAAHLRSLISSLGSPEADELASLTSASSTLVRQGDRLSSSECADEFTSFILPAGDQLAAGPTLVAVHSARPMPSPSYHHSGPLVVGRTAAPPVGAPDKRLARIQHQDQRAEFQLDSDSSSSSSSSEDDRHQDNQDNHSSLDDSELLLLDQHRVGAPDGGQPDDTHNDSHNAKAFKQQHQDQLDSYLRRVECLLRLRAGDSAGVSLDEALAGAQSIEVSEEHMTRFEHTPIDRPPASVVRELELHCGSLERTVITADFRSQLAHSEGVLPQLKLDWLPDSLQDTAEACQSNTSLPLHCIARAESLLEALEGRLIKALGAPADAQARGQVRALLRDHCATFESHQAQLAEQMRDWRQNWLFAYKRPLPGGELAPEVCGAGQKRARVDFRRAGSGPGDVELLTYATLVVARARIAITCPPAGSGCHSDIEAIYSARDELEARNQAIALSRQPDVCKLLLLDQFEDQEQPGQQLKPTPPDSSKRAFRVSYASSTRLAEPAALRGRHSRVVAHGYLFELRRLGALAGERARDRVLAHLSETFGRVEGGPRGSCPSGSCERVRFTVPMGDVQLSRRLPVIQFCSRVAGSLPLRVRWFRRPLTAGSGGHWSPEAAGELLLSGDEHLNSSSSSLARGTQLEISASPAARGPNKPVWPLELRAEHDYQVKSGWSSTYRFWRRRDQIVFEIREPCPKRDFDCLYRCELSNCCSRTHCEFSLTERPPPEAPAPEAASHKTDRKRAPANSKGADNAAILRTWSQRTLHRPAPSELREPGAPQATPPSDQCDLPASAGSCTLARRSHLLQQDQEARSELVLGPDFPYHPANLLRRLELNKLPAAFGSTMRPSGPQPVALAELVTVGSLQRAPEGAPKPQEPIQAPATVGWQAAQPEEANGGPEVAAEQPEVVPAVPLPRPRTMRQPGAATTLAAEATSRSTGQGSPLRNHGPELEAGGGGGGGGVRSLISRFNAGPK